ncbi:MAG: glycosyltransferase family 4 protein [Verrucomicrobiota bacterium]|nr:glycosyltransferase family 4 protein [Verrucomicrobiota bacterium]
MVRITLIHYSYPPVIGGVETILAEHARLFSAEGHQVTVLCGNEARETGAICVRSLPEIADRETPAARVVAGVAPLLKREEVVFMHNVMTMHFHPGLTAALWQLASSLPAVRFVSWIHDLAAGNPDYPLPPLTEAPWSFLAAAHDQMEYVAVSDHRARQFKKLTGRVARVIPNGVDPARFLGLSPSVARLVKEHAIFERDWILLHPARFLRRKNVELGLRVTAALRALPRQAVYLLTGAHDAQQAGDSTYRAELRALRRELGLEEEVLFLNNLFAVTTPDLISLFSVADALFFPSRQEGFGLPILEAALHRLPVFCSSLEPMNALVHHGLTTFAPESSPAAIAATIAGHLDASPATRARKEVVRRYCWETIHRDFLQPLLASAQTHSPP